MASQAAMMSGISDQVIKQMMPVRREHADGGLFKGAMSNGLGGLFGQDDGQPPQPSPQASNTLRQQPLAGMMGQFMEGMMGQKPAPPPQDPMSAGLQMLRGMFRQRPAGSSASNWTRSRRSSSSSAPSLTSVRGSR